MFIGAYKRFFDTLKESAFLWLKLGNRLILIQSLYAVPVLHSPFHDLFSKRINVHFMRVSYVLVILNHETCVWKEISFHSYTLKIMQAFNTYSGKIWTCKYDRCEKFHIYKFVSVCVCACYYLTLLKFLSIYSYLSESKCLYFEFRLRLYV